MKLKNEILLSLIILISVFNSLAQETSNHKAIHGFLFGLTIGKINKEIQGADYNSRAAAGASLGYKYLKGINDNFSGSFEILYNTRVARYEAPNRDVQSFNISDGSSSTAENYHFYSFRYFEVPLIVYWHPNQLYLDHRSDDPKPNLKIGVGFSSALTISAKAWV